MEIRTPGTGALEQNRERGQGGFPAAASSRSRAGTGGVPAAPSPGCGQGPPAASRVEHVLSRFGWVYRGLINCSRFEPVLPGARPVAALPVAAGTSPGAPRAEAPPGSHRAIPPLSGGHRARPAPSWQLLGSRDTADISRYFSREGPSTPRFPRAHRGALARGACCRREGQDGGDNDDGAGEGEMGRRDRAGPGRAGSSRAPLGPGAGMGGGRPGAPPGPGPHRARG